MSVQPSPWFLFLILLNIIFLSLVLIRVGLGLSVEIRNCISQTRFTIYKERLNVNEVRRGNAL
jgi:hypothetical protein